MMEVVAVSVPVDEGKQVLPADVDKAKGTQQAGSKQLLSDCRKDERERANGCEGEVTALFNGMRFVVDVDGRLDQSIDWASLIRQCGGQSTNTVSNETTHLITTMAQVDRRSFAVQEAIQNGKQTLILTEQFLVDCLQQKRVCAVKNYILPVVSAADILAAASDASSSSPSVVSLGLTTNGWHSHVDENQDKSAPVIEAEEDVDKAIQKQKIEDVEMDTHEHVNGEETQANGNGEGLNPQPTEETIKEHKDTENEQNKDENEVVEERGGQIDDDEDEEELDISAYLPGKKMWRYREFGAPYFPHSYEIECMDFLVQKRAEGSQKPKKFFVMELHSGDYFGRQSFRVFFHAGCTGSTDEEKWCLYFENGQDAERAYRTLIEAKLANTHVRYDLNFIVSRNFIVGSDLARRFLEMGWMFLRRMQAYTEEPILEEGMDLVEQIKETLSKCTPASPISLLLQSPEMVSLVLKNSFLELSSRNEMTDNGEDQGDDDKKEQEKEKEKGIEFDFADDVMLEYCEMSPEEIRREMEMAWRDVCFGLIEAGSNFNGFYKERKVVPIFEELIKNSGLYLHQLLKPFMGQQTEASGEPKKVTMTVGQIVPFGKDRLCTVKFVSVLVKAQREAGIEDLLVKEIPSTSVTTPEEAESLSLLRCAVESLFAFPWNNVLHCQVVEIVKEIFKSHSDGVDDEGFYVESQKCSRLERYLLEDCALLEKILKVHGRVEEDGENGDAVRKPKQGNLGHITTICNCMVARGDTLFQEFWQAEGGPWPMLLDEWREFVETKLKQINARENATFFKPPMLFSSRHNNYWN